MNNRMKLLTIIGAVIITFNLYLFNMWNNTISWKNLDNSTIPPSGQIMIQTFLARPAIIFLPGWGVKGAQLFTGLFLLSILVVILRLLQGRDLLYGYKPIDCRLRTLFWIVASVTFTLAFVGTGATLNFFWDVTHNIPYFPWHGAAHAGLGFTITTIAYCLDVEETFQCKYRWKALLILGSINIFSLYLEVTENLMVIQSGLQSTMFNNLTDSIFDICLVLVGCLIGERMYHGFQYAE